MDRSNGAPTEALTVTQMDQVMRDDLARLDEAGRAWAAEESRWEHNESRNDIGGPNGEGADAIRAALLEAARPDYEAAARAAEGAALAAESNVRGILRQLAGDRITLPADKRPVAAQLQALVDRDAERLPLPRLAAEVRAAFAAGDDVACYLFARAVPDRLGKKADPNAKKADPNAERPEDEAARGELGRLLLQIREKLRDTSTDAQRKRAAEVLEKADTLRARASKGRRRVGGEVPTTMDGRPKVAWPEPERGRVAS